MLFAPMCETKTSVCASTAVCGTERRTVTLLGSAPNDEAVAWFLREVWPRVRAEVPGLDADDIDLQVTGDRLVIRAAHKSETGQEKGQAHAWQQREYYQSVLLPAGVNVPDGFATTAQCGDAPADAAGVLLDQDCARLALERL